MVRHFLLVGLAVSAALGTALAADWPQFRGPHRDDVSVEKGLLHTWPENGPPLLWKASGIGGGYSSVSIAGDCVYTLGNKGDKTYVYALGRDNGKVLWSTELGPAGGNLGSTPTVDGDRI